MQNREYEIRAHGASCSDDERRRLEGQLRELCCWYELAEPPNLGVAGLLQDTADRIGTLDPVVARAMLEMYRPFAWAEPPSSAEANRQAAIVSAVKDLHRMLKAAPAEDKPWLAALLRDQIAILEGGAR